MEMVFHNSFLLRLICSDAMRECNLITKRAGPPESIFDWTKELGSELSNHNSSNQAFSRKHWRLLQCQNG